MLRNFVGCIAGVLLSYVLIFAGWRLAWVVIVGTADHTDNKGAIVTLMVVQTAIIAPAVSLVVGAVVSSIVVRSRWWLGGVAIVPLIIHGFIRSGADRPEIIFSVVCIVLALAAALAGSRFKPRLLRTGMPNKSLDASGERVFLNLIHPAMLE
jgi:hypothetical protein